MIHISNEFYINSGNVTGSPSAGLPIIGYQSILSNETVSADYNPALTPVINLVNEQTNQFWKSSSLLEQHIYFDNLSFLDVDYIGIAKHNFGTGNIAYVFQGGNGTSGYQAIDLGGAVGLLDVAFSGLDGEIDLSEYEVDGVTYTDTISLSYGVEQVTYAQFIEDFNADVESIAHGITMALVEGVLTISSNTIGSGSSFEVLDSTYGGILDNFVGFETPVQGTGEATWTDITTLKIPENNNAILEYFDTTNFIQYRLKLTPDEVLPQIAHVKVGEALIMPRCIRAPHRSITISRSSDIVTNTSEDGAFLNRVLKRQYLQSEYDFKNVDPLYYRQYIDPFSIFAVEHAFFIAWKPLVYPTEVAYAWCTNPDITFVADNDNGMGTVSFGVKGIA